MSDLDDILKCHDVAFDALETGQAGLERVRGRLEPLEALDAEALGELLGGLDVAAGWLQYQSELIRLTDAHQPPAVDHPEAGRLLDAELLDRSGESLLLRFDGANWRGLRWRPDDDADNEWLAEPLSFRLVGGGQARYWRLWTAPEDRPLRPAAAVLIAMEPESSQSEAA